MYFFDVKENEIFHLKNIDCGEILKYDYRINNNKLEKYDKNMNIWTHSPFLLNSIINYKVVKLKQFTEDELIILKNIEIIYKYIARDKDESISVYEGKPTKSDEYWNDIDITKLVKEMPFENIFKSIKWEDNRAVYIDDYVNRKQN